MDRERTFEFPAKEYQTHNRASEAIRGCTTSRKLAVIHVKVQQKVSSELEKGNELVDKEAKQAAKREATVTAALIPDGQISLEEKSNYTKEDRKLITDLKGSYNEDGWAISPQKKAHSFILNDMVNGSRGAQKGTLGSGGAIQTPHKMDSCLEFIPCSQTGNATMSSLSPD